MDRLIYLVCILRLSKNLCQIACDEIVRVTILPIKWAWPRHFAKRITYISHVGGSNYPIKLSYPLLNEDPYGDIKQSKKYFK